MGRQGGLERISRTHGSCGGPDPGTEARRGIPVGPVGQQCRDSIADVVSGCPAPQKPSRAGPFEAAAQHFVVGLGVEG